MWQSLNLLLHLRNTWVGSADMSGLEALQNAPLVNQQATDLDQPWVDALDLIDRELQAWATELARLGTDVPAVGYELLDGKGRVVAEAELAWVEQQLAVLLPDSAGLTLFAELGWYCITATGGDLPDELKTRLKEKQT